jgi:hypothetical protein
MLVSDVTPLCPAGHLPHKGGKWLEALSLPRIRLVCQAWDRRMLAMSAPHPFSPLVGEMPGRAEGGARHG